MRTLGEYGTTIDAGWWSYSGACNPNVTGSTARSGPSSSNEASIAVRTRCGLAPVYRSTASNNATRSASG